LIAFCVTIELRPVGRCAGEKQQQQQKKLSPFREVFVEKFISGTNDDGECGILNKLARRERFLIYG
jgi:hypothetical protein